MLYRELLTTELLNQREEFTRFADEQAVDLADYLAVLQNVARLSASEVAGRISDNENVGGIPSSELDSQDSFSQKFTEKWANHEQARGWAFQILENRTTFAADASQILPGRDISLPVAAIQVGWFENPHDDTKAYEKNARFRILSPRDLLEGQEEPMNPETRVGEMRFHAEVERVAEFLSKKQGWRERGERMPLAFFDGTLLVSFSLPQTSLQKRYVDAMVGLVRHSQATRVPLVGYVDRSYSRDLLGLLDAFEDKVMAPGQTLYDATLLSSSITNFQKVLGGWGDRTCFCYSKRRGLSAFTDEETGGSLVGFTYLQTTADSQPARIDIPSWVYEVGLLDELVDVIRAECVVGLGYPYALETADATAVISVSDRDVFLGALQEFATREKLNFSVSRKSISKGRRR